MSKHLHPLIGPLAALAVLVAGLAIAYWAPWSSDTRERELEYLETLSAWLVHVPQRGQAPDECAADFDRSVGAAPSQRLRAAARIARAGCAPAASDTHWLDVEWGVRSNLIDSRFAAADTTPEPGLARVVRDVIEGAHVNCWTRDDWQPLVEEWGIFARGEFWGLQGFADPPRHAMHLAPEVCEPLRRFFTSSYTPHLNEESFQLAEALKILVHEAEHLHHPYASEAVVECYAMQGVRQVVLEAGRQASYANEMSLLAWEIGYPYMPASYRTRRCRDGSRLDLHPSSSLWP